MAFPGKRSTTYQVDPNDLKIVGLDTDHGEDHPLYQGYRNELPLEEEKILTTMEHGAGDSLVVACQVGKCSYVVAGRQRTRYLREANKRLKKAGKPGHTLTVKNVSALKGDRKALVGIMVRENALRTDLTPLEKAKLAKRMTEDDGFTIPECAVEFGVSDQSVKDWLAVINAAPKVVKAVEKGKLSFTKALPVARKKPEQQEEKLAEVLAKATTASAPTKIGTTGKPSKRNMNKSYAKHMAGDTGGKLNKQVTLMLQWCHGTATTAECEREITGFKQTLSRARKALAE